ncbi:mitochondrial import inner membrane translocase subunit Tim13 isoform X2 [Macrobrachium rosenbergii]|uniref:mitochondrial import inner membrane translocase subunit Tim13 isoform X2 n=1 Tax=Macrobrachium rosenbergii TaxID=79674 RepID=UPI0034D6E25C
MESLGGAGGRLTSSQREELMDQVKQQIVIANTQELLTKMGEKCFSKCISKPGSSLDSSEQILVLACLTKSYRQSTEPSFTSDTC